MSAARLTVGIPTFNRAEWLRETMESVLAQTFTSFRLIVSDNASDDDTPNVIRSFGDERIDYVRSDRNVGLIGNFNRLVELTDTEFLMILPDDDILYPGHLEAAVDVLERSDAVGLAHSAFNLIDAQSRVVHRLSPLGAHSRVRIERRDRALDHMMVSSWPMCFSSVVYRTKAFLEAGGFREEEEPFADLELWMRMALDWDFGYIGKPLVGFRVHPEQASMILGERLGVTADARKLGLLHAQIRWQRRVNFLDHARLQPASANRLRALAALELLAERASSGLPGSKVAAELANLARTYPRIVLRPELRRLVVMQLGGRRVDSALRRASSRLRRSVKGWLDPSGARAESRSR